MFEMSEEMSDEDIKCVVDGLKRIETDLTRRMAATIEPRVEQRLGN